MAFPCPKIALSEIFCAGETGLVLSALRLGAREIRFAPIDSVLIGTRPYFGANQPLLYLHINVAKNILDCSGNGGIDKEGLLQIDDAFGLHRPHNRAAANSCRDKVD